MTRVVDVALALCCTAVVAFAAAVLVDPRAGLVVLVAVLLVGRLTRRHEPSAPLFPAFLDGSPRVSVVDGQRPGERVMVVTVRGREVERSPSLPVAELRAWSQRESAYVAIDRVSA